MRHHEQDDTSPALRSRRRARGQSVVELAIILPVLLLVTLGIVDFARVFTSYISLSNAVREGALYAGSASYTTWCAVASGVDDIPCPAGTASGNRKANPDNIAYRMSTEAIDMIRADIVMVAPQCTADVNANFATGAPCATKSDAYLYVKVTASYQVPLMTPLFDSIFGGGVPISATTVAKIVSGS